DSSCIKIRCRSACLPRRQLSASADDRQICVPSWIRAKNFPCGEKLVQPFATVAQRAYENDDRPIVSPAQHGSRMSAFIDRRRAETLRVNGVVNRTHALVDDA